MACGLRIHESHGYGQSTDCLFSRLSAGYEHYALARVDRARDSRFISVWIFL